jgi:GntP family gluconate:H+ symporter
MTEEVQPTFWAVLGLLLLPLILIFGETGLNTLVEEGVVDGENAVVQVVRMLGQTPVALLIAVLVALIVLGITQRREARDLERITDSAFGPRRLDHPDHGCRWHVRRGPARERDRSGVGRHSRGDRVAGDRGGVRYRDGHPRGSGISHVALITTASLISPVVAEGDFSNAYRALTVIAIAGGATVLSHVNDSGFWLVGRF